MYCSFNILTYFASFCHPEQTILAKITIKLATVVYSNRIEAGCLYQKVQGIKVRVLNKLILAHSHSPGAESGRLSLALKTL